MREACDPAGARARSGCDHVTTPPGDEPSVLGPFLAVTPGGSGFRSRFLPVGLRPDVSGFGFFGKTSSRSSEGETLC